MDGWTGLRALLASREVACRRILLGLDFDGTLADIAATPARAALSAGTRDLLIRLSGRADTRVAVLSGRQLRDLKSKVGLPGLYYSGNHGLELSGRGLRWRHPRATGLAPAFRRRLEDALAGFPGALAERKGLGFAVHYRRVPSARVRRLRGRVQAVLAELDGRHRVVTSKKAFDIRPAVRWDKGRTLQAIRGRLRGDWLVVFVGDDRTDEEAFRTLGSRAVTVRVGRAARTGAAFRLARRGQVDVMLDLLARRPVRRGA